MIYRRATRDTKAAAGSLRACNIPKETMVLAANSSAMFDPSRIIRRSAFELIGLGVTTCCGDMGMHTCFGARINRAVMPAVLKPLLAKAGLRRAAGAAGRIDCAGTPFPQHLSAVWDWEHGLVLVKLRRALHRHFSRDHAQAA